MITERNLSVLDHHFKNRCVNVYCGNNIINIGDLSQTIIQYRAQIIVTTDGFRVQKLTENMV